MRINLFNMHLYLLNSNPLALHRACGELMDCVKESPIYKCPSIDRLPSNQVELKRVDGLDREHGNLFQVLK